MLGQMGAQERQSTTRITIWQRFDKDTDEWQHNHIYLGYSESATQPEPKGRTQRRTWKKGRWRSYSAYLDDKSVVIRE